MYDIIKRVIQTGGYRLSTVQQKIDSLWAEGVLTDDQRQELHKLALEGASVAGDVDLLSKVLELERRVRALEAPEEDPEVYPPYVEGKWYYAGDRCSENGKHYTCIAPEGVVCVWAPGVYPAYWEEVTDNG